MFRTNHNQDRVSYSDALLPPDGFTLEKAVGTTYSLDLEALTAVSIALGLREEPDSDLLRNPISLLNALVNVSEKILIFCEAGQIKKPKKSSPLLLLLDKMVVPVTLPKKTGKGPFPSFHPKTWVLQYRNAEGSRKYRFVVLSRNLTFDRSWDVSICIESSKDIYQPEKTKPVIEFLGFLYNQITETTKGFLQKQALLDSFISDLNDVSLSLDNPKFGENFTIMPLGIGQGEYDLSKDPLYCQLPWKADYSFHELVVFSPFISNSMIDYWNKADHSLTGTTRTLITRRSELGKLTTASSSRFRVFVLKDDIVEGEEYISDEASEKQRQDIHAKIYLRRKYADTDLYIGSMNASYTAVHDNVEMMIRIGTRKHHYNGELFLRELFGGDENGSANPFEEIQVTISEEIQETDETNALEKAIKELCRIKMCAEIVPSDDRYDVLVHMDREYNPEGLEISLSPLRRDSFIPVMREMKFPGMEVMQLTDFFQVMVKGQTADITRIIMIPTTGLPEDRESAVVNSVIKDKRSFVEYIALILGDDYLFTLLEESLLGKTGFFGKQADRIPALYEKMLKTSLEEPERLKEIDYILRMIKDSNVVPEEFRTLYGTFKETLHLT